MDMVELAVNELPSEMFGIRLIPLIKNI
uniref:Uncharacterized protein n=1 Tax=Onchocerca volvulus TaxID=6282 RepID=A0A2K6VI97_ONCVO